MIFKNKQKCERYCVNKNDKLYMSIIIIYKILF